MMTTPIQSLRWSRGAGLAESANNLASSFPSIQFDADDVMRGAVKVYAQSPSGRTQLMSVLDTDGMYNANFTPDEVGDWTVSILYEDKDIEGSPFKVRVYDPGMIRVMGLDGGLAGRDYTFSIDASMAGEGSLTIDITHNGHIIPAQIAPDPAYSRQFNVRFAPQGTGFYTIRVFFADIEVSGSPYTIEIIDCCSIMASGAGLTTGQVHHRSVFTVNIGQTGVMSDCRVTVYDPYGVQTPFNTIDQHDGSLRIEFTPVTVGDHRIDVLYCNKPINGSPFHCKVSDWSQIKVTNLPPNARVGKSVEFDIDALHAGSGDLEVMVNGGTVPCTVQSIGQRRFHGSFIPRVAIPHDIAVVFSGQEVSGSPWKVDVINASQVTMVGPGLDVIATGCATWFDVRGIAVGTEQDLVVNIMSPSKRMVQSKVTSIQGGICHVEYTPNEVGTYSIEVIYDSRPVPNSPLSCKAYDTSAISCSQIPLAVVDEPVEFTVDASRAGDGQLEITVDHGAVPNTARPIAKGIFAVSFVPIEARVYVVEITFNGELCKFGILNVPVIDVNQITIKGPSHSVPVNRPSMVRVITITAGEAELSAKITAPSGVTVPCCIQGCGGKAFDIEFTPTEAGMHEVNIKYGNTVVPACPIHIKAYDVSHIRVSDIQDGILNQESLFKVDTTAAGDGDLLVTVSSPSGAAINNYIRPLSPTLYGVFFTPQHSGIHLINVEFNGESVSGNPFRVNIIDPSKASARGDGLDIVQCGQTASFFVSAPSSLIKDYDIRIIGPNSKDVMYRTSDAGTNTYKVDYVPTVPGEYRIEVLYFGQSIPGSAFTANAWDINKVSVSNITAGHVGMQSSFNINVKDAGEGTLEIGICGPSGQNISNNVTALGPGHFMVAYLPLESGQHRANVTFNGDSVNGNPFTFLVTDSNKVVARGDGLNMIKCNQPTSFIITAPGAQLKDLDVRVTGPNGRDVTVRCNENGTNCFRASYTPTIAGDYTIDISCFDQQIPGNPFVAQASDISRVVVSKIAACVVGQHSTFSIDVRNAGDGTLEISIIGPSGQHVPNSVTAQGQGLFLVSYAPSESGQHRANITFNKESVSGNPFTFLVIDPLKVTARGDGLGSIHCGQQTFFIVTAPAAEQSDLEIIITAVDGKELTYRVSECGNNSFKVEYTPTYAGDELIEINYFGQAILGSPFTAKVWDASKVLVSQISPGRVGIQSTFGIDVKGAGEGTLEIGISGPSGQNIPNSVVSLGSSQFEVSFLPTESGPHRANIMFNKENVVGSPFQFIVTDLNRVYARGDGLGIVKCSQTASFVVTAPAAQLKDVDVCITGPSDMVVVACVTEQGVGCYKYDYTPMVAGDYKISISYFNQPIPFSPFVVKAWDASKVVVTNISIGRVGCQSSFNIDTRAAGDGCLEVNITATSAKSVQNNIVAVGPGLFEVTFFPVESGPHYLAVTFNNEVVPGSKFKLLVIDPLRATAHGDGLGLIHCNQATSFIVTGPAAQKSDVTVSVVGPQNKVLPIQMSESTIPGNFVVEYTPTIIGHYVISLCYFGEIISGSPFTAKAWDASSVVVNGLKPGCIGKQSAFNVNLSHAGEGSLEVTVSAHGEAIPNTVQATGNGSYIVSFTPQTAEVHFIIVKFNNEMVPGSPFSVIVLDGHRATAAGDGLSKYIIANRPTAFDVNTKIVGGDAELDVTITSPRGQQVRPKVTGLPSSGFHVEYIPVEAGCYMIDIKYAESSITGSPFYPDVFDPCQVRVGCLPQGILGKPFVFDVDATMAGNGRLVVDVRGQLTRPLVNVIAKSDKLYSVSFVPQECCCHTVTVTFNDIPVPNCPFSCNIIDVASIFVDWDAIRLRPVHCPALITIDALSSPDADITCTVTDPAGHNIQTKLCKMGTVCKAEFVGHSVGPYRVELMYGGTAIPGSPYTCNMYDVTRVRITDASLCGNVGQQALFTVDTSDAGLGDLDVQIVCKEERIPAQVQPVGTMCNRYTFVPMTPFNHLISVKYNSEDVPGSPMLLRVINPASQMLLVGSSMIKPLAVGQTTTAVLQTKGIAINITDLSILLLSPDGGQLTCKIIPQVDNSIQLEYSSRVCGETRLEVQYAGQPIPGSPMMVQFFDPSKILVEGCPNGIAGELVVLDVIASGAGKADLMVTIKDSKGTVVPFDMKPSAVGYQIMYKPTTPGCYMVQMSYGGLDIPGCPVYQQIDDNVLPSVNGDGLHMATENSPAYFTVNTTYQGDLAVSVEGPNSICRCNIEQSLNGDYKVTYIPIEVGVFNITVKWNGHEIPGSPFHPVVCNPDKLKVVGGWLALYGGFDKIRLKVSEIKMIEFDSRQAGPGQLSMTAVGPEGNPVSTNVVQCADNRFSASFVPPIPGEYLINVSWAGKLLQRCPMVGIAIVDLPKSPSPTPSKAPLTIAPENVVLIGPGLSNACVLEEAEFILDGSNAGPGIPIIRMMGVKCDVNVSCVPIGQDRYKCCYKAEVPGAYLLSITWSDYQVPGSPFKVSVISGTDASKVTCTASGLNGGIVGQEQTAIIDTRKAGPGELMATCHGPNKPAVCQLEDQHDGTFLVTIKAQEIGNHQLRITYAGDPIQGSPFILRITAATDASKVRVSGRGIQSGILATFQSDFIVETRGAGPGRLTVRVRGPKGAFRVEMAPDPSRDRAIVCRYNPAEVGLYVLLVKWSGDNVPGSPFEVRIVDTRQELEMLGSSNSAIANGNSQSSTYGGICNSIGYNGIYNGTGSSTYNGVYNNQAISNEPIYIEGMSDHGSYTGTGDGEGLMFTDDV